MESVQPRQIQEVGARLKTVFHSPIPHHLDFAGLGYRFCTQSESGEKKLVSLEAFITFMRD